MEFLIPGTTHEMTNEEFWLNKLSMPEKVLMTPEELKVYNNKIKMTIPSMKDLTSYPDFLSYDELHGLITNYKMPNDIRYDDDGVQISDESYNKIVTNTSLNSIKETNSVNLGLTIKATRLRSFPTDMGCYKENDCVEFDRFQETEVGGADAVAILHTSNDGEWHFVQAYNYAGWIRAEDVAVAHDRSLVTDYIKSGGFIIVTGDSAKTQFNYKDERLSRRIFYMGTKLPVINNIDYEIGNQSSAHNYTVKLPLRDKNGCLEFGTALMSKREPVHAGYLQLTIENLLKQAFTLLGDRYDWGNKNNGRDCSGYVMNIYKTCGIELPRNADHQENCPGKHELFDENMLLSQRLVIFEKFLPGALIFMNGHVMLYIGMHEGVPYMVHDFYRYSTGKDASFKVHTANEIAVTQTLLNTSEGKEFIMKFTSILMPK